VKTKLLHHENPDSYNKLTVFFNAYLRHVMRWIVCRLSVKRVGLYDEKMAPVSTSIPNVLLLFVQRNSRKHGPWNYSPTCRPVLTQVLVPKTTRETVKNLGA